MTQTETDKEPTWSCESDQAEPLEYTTEESKWIDQLVVESMLHPTRIVTVPFKFAKMRLRHDYALEVGLGYAPGTSTRLLTVTQVNLTTGKRRKCSRRPPFLDESVRTLAYESMANKLALHGKAIEAHDPIAQRVRSFFHEQLKAEEWEALKKTSTVFENLLPTTAEHFDVLSIWAIENHILQTRYAFKKWELMRQTTGDETKERMVPSHTRHTPCTDMLQRLGRWLGANKASAEAKDAAVAVKERLLFHGTDISAALDIVRDGFDARLSTKHGALLGRGSYFATSSQLAHKYASPLADGVTHVMLAAHVLVGESTLGHPLYTRCPTSTMASVVNDLSHPAIYSVFDPYQVCPQYVILYRRKTNVL